jgi:hypothetical protein
MKKLEIIKTEFQKTRKLIIALVKCSAIEGILHRYHHCGPVCMLEVKGKCRGISLQMAFRIFRCHRAFKPTRGRSTPRLGPQAYLASTWMFGDSSF